MKVEHHRGRTQLRLNDDNTNTIEKSEATHTHTQKIYNSASALNVHIEYNCDEYIQRTAISSRKRLWTIHRLNAMLKRDI